MQAARSLIRLAALLTAALLISCAQPVPPARASYVGDWQAENLRLTITAGGEVHYFRQRGNSRTTIDMPLKAFEGDDFIVGFGPFTTRFKVSKPPHQEGNVWKMTVDDVEVVRGLTPGDTKA
jgi:hypothetical protein